MKRLFSAVWLGALILGGCNRAPAPLPDSREMAASTPKVMPMQSPEAFRPETRNLAASDEVPLLEQIDRENTRVVNAALPSVVRIIASRPADPRLRLFGNKIPFQLPFAPKSRPDLDADDTAYSSGVILSRDGYILTNQHAISDAVSDFTSFQVQLHDKRTFRARVVAADERVDVAILKIDAGDLTPLPWGDSDKVQVGEQVFAIGNPFDLADSVSKGIVSAKERNVREPPGEVTHYEDFIQTDAAINPGNSGGALINIHGELIGLNAAIASSTRYNMGIGFAIPSNLVRYAVGGLFKEGRLVRGYLGVILPDSVDDGVVGELNLKSSQGALLADITPGSPAEKAKLQPFDFITAVDSHKIDSEAGLSLVVAQLPIGKKVEVDFVRQGKSQSTTVQITEPPADDDRPANIDAANQDSFPIQAREIPPGANVLSGLEVAQLDDKNRQKFNVDRLVTSGVIVTGVQEGSPAEDKKIERGDVIENAAINRGSTQPLATPKDFGNLAGGLKPDQGVVLLVHDNQLGNSFIYLAPPAK
jgi:serine protease Do